MKREQLNYGMHEQHTDSHKTTGGPPKESWSLSKSTPRTQQVEFTIKIQKRSFGTILAM